VISFEQWTNEMIGRLARTADRRQDYFTIASVDRYSPTRARLIGEHNKIVPIPKGVLKYEASQALAEHTQAGR
jgi:hypothetical protein